MSLTQVYAKTIPPSGAMQLRWSLDQNVDNAREIVDWCGGSFKREFDEEGDLSVHISLGGDNQPWYPMGSWVVKFEEGHFQIFDGDDFHNHFGINDNETKEICTYCLSDPRFTPMGDAEYDRICPECSVRYNGPKRSQEYAALHAAGLVRVE